MTQKFIAAVFGATLFAGCMSIDEQLNSSDPTVRAQSEKRLEHIVLDTNEWTGGATKEERIAAIQKISDQDTLLRILTTNLNDGRFNGEYWELEFRTDEELYGSCVDKLDQHHLVEFILHEEQYYDKNFAQHFGHDFVKERTHSHKDGMNETSESYSAELLLSAVGGDGPWFEYFGSSRGDRAMGSLDSFEMAVKYQKEPNKRNRPERLWYALSKLSHQDAVASCLQRSRDGAVKFVLFPIAFKNWQMMQGKYELAAILKIACLRQIGKQGGRGRGSDCGARGRTPVEYVVTDAIKKGIVAKIADQKVYDEMLDKKGKFGIGDVGVVFAVASEMPKDKVYELARRELNNHTIELWNKHDIGAFAIANAAVTKSIDVTKKGLLTKLAVGILESYYNRCHTQEGLVWDDEDRAQAKQIIVMWGDALSGSDRQRLAKLTSVTKE